MAINIALTVMKIHENKLVLMPENDNARYLLNLTKSKFFLPKDLNIARQRFGMELHVVNGGNLLSDGKIPEQYRGYILSHLRFNSIA